MTQNWSRGQTRVVDVVLYWDEICKYTRSPKAVLLWRRLSRMLKMTCTHPHAVILVSWSHGYAYHRVFAENKKQYVEENSASWFISSKFMR